MAILNVPQVCWHCAAGALLALAFTAADTNLAAFAQDDEKSSSQLRKEAESAEKDLFSIFNDINSDDDFDVRCKKEKALGSRRKVQVCTPKFQRRLEATMSADQTGPGGWDWPSPPGSQMQKKKDSMRQEMNELLATNEDFSAAFARYAEAKRAYTTRMQNN